MEQGFSPVAVCKPVSAILHCSIAILAQVRLAEQRRREKVEQQTKIRTLGLSVPTCGMRHVPKDAKTHQDQIGD